MPARLTALLLALLLAPLLLMPRPVEAAPERSPARKAADAVLAALPAPTPAIDYDYKGDLVLAGLWAGETRYTAKVAKVGRQVVWRVTQETYIDYAGAETRIRVLVHLKPDLSILSGTYERREKKGSLSAAFSRSGSGLLVQRRLVEGEADAKTDVAEVGAEVRATTSIAALLLFLRATPGKAKAAYELPWVSMGALQREKMQALAQPMRLVVKGKASWGEGKKARKTWLVEAGHGRSSFQLHLTPDRLGLVGIRMPGGQGDVVPRGEGGERLTVRPDLPAATWKDAFLKFGFGYHLPRKSLLEVAFHWEAMYEYETKVLKRWDAGRSIEEFKQAWVDEFVGQSKHRTIHDTRRLLSMTLGTGKLEKETKDEVVFAAHRNFGGGVQRTYYLRCIDGVWGITRIDF